MEPIATYLERRTFWQYRKFELFEDHITIAGGIGRQPASHVKVDLINLRSDPNKIFVRDKVTALVFLFLMALMLPYMFSNVIAVFKQIDSLDNTPLVMEHLLPILGIAVFVILFVFFLFPAIEFAQFVQKSAGLPLLDVAKAGPDKQKHKDFVSLLSFQISKASQLRNQSV